MQSALSPNPTSANYPSTAPGYQAQGAQQQQIPDVGSSNIAAGFKRPYHGGIGDLDGRGQSYQRPPQLDLDAGRRSTETPSRDESHPRDGDSSTASPAGAGDGQTRKKQKRNKPTLSCFECVERKTKACYFLPYAVNAISCATVAAGAAAPRQCRGPPSQKPARGP